MMEKRRKKVALVFAAVLLLVALVRYVDLYPGIEKKGIDQRIIFIYNYVNFAEGYQNNGVFVDEKGNVVKYDLSDGDWERATFAEELAYLENMEYDESDVVMKLNMSELEKNFSYLYKVNPNARIKERFRFVHSYDAGQRSLYGVAYLEEEEPTFIMIRSQGDNNYENTNRYARKISRWWGRVSQKDKTTPFAPFK